MDTNSDQQTSIAHLFAPANSPEAAPASPALTEQQPAPPDVDSGFPPHVTEAQPQLVQSVPGQEQPPVQPPQPQTVPLAELIETRRRAQAAEEALRAERRRIDQIEDTMRRLTQAQQPVQQQPQQQGIDPVEDPAGFARAIEARIEERFLNQSLNESERRARTDHGSQLVDAALEAARRAGMAASFISRPDAYGELVRWHKGQELLDAIGTDPNAYQEQLKAQIRQQVLAEMKTGSPPPSNLPPSLSSATRASPSQAPLVDTSDKDFFNEMMNRKRG